MSREVLRPREKDPEGDAFHATRRALNEDLTALRREIAVATVELAAFAQRLKDAHG